MDARSATDEGLTPLHAAAQGGHAGVVRVLVEARADVNAREKKQGVIPLFVAARDGTAAAVAALVSAGADVRATTEGGFTALHAAAERGDQSIVQVLLRNGAPADARARDGVPRCTWRRRRGRVRWWPR